MLACLKRLKLTGRQPVSKRRREPVSVPSVPFSTLGINPDRFNAAKLRDYRNDPPDEGDDEFGPFEGPRLHYSLLLGESPTWSGPESLWLYFLDGQRVCRFCFHLSKMPAYAYCLHCDRAGREMLIGPAPLAKRVKARHAYTPDPVLKGGQG